MMTYNEALKTHHRCMVACADMRDDCLSDQAEEMHCGLNYEECRVLCDLDYAP